MKVTHTFSLVAIVTRQPAAPPTLLGPSHLAAKGLQVMGLFPVYEPPELQTSLSIARCKIDIRYCCQQHWQRKRKNTRPPLFFKFGGISHEII